MNLKYLFLSLFLLGGCKQAESIIPKEPQSIVERGNKGSWSFDGKNGEVFHLIYIPSSDSFRIAVFIPNEKERFGNDLWIGDIYKPETKVGSRSDY